MGQGVSPVGNVPHPHSASQTPHVAVARPGARWLLLAWKCCLDNPEKGATRVPGLKSDEALSGEPDRWNTCNNEK